MGSSTRGRHMRPAGMLMLAALCLLALGGMHARAEDATEGEAGSDYASQFEGEDDKPKKVTAHPDADERRADEVRVGVGGPPADADLIRTPRRAAPRAVPHGPPRVSSSSDDLFFGWSTGHVGSTSLSTSSAYASSATRSMRSFAFRFEFLRRSRFDISRLFIKANGTVAHQTDTAALSGQRALADAAREPARRAHRCNRDGRRGRAAGRAGHGEGEGCTSGQAQWQEVASLLRRASRHSPGRAGSCGHVGSIRSKK
mmetsp:Transcript_1369/g.3543  ORF Transcript_1369/g.3543 Transcript_1369/m.3543 type:complete len:257 (+) Transcript_1369:26-796(+)